MKHFIKLGNLLVASSEVLYINTECRRIYFKNKNYLDYADYTGELELEQFEEVDPTEKMFQIIEKAKEEAKDFKPNIEVPTLFGIPTCKLVEELEKRIGVKKEVLEDSGCSCLIRKFEYDKNFKGPGTTILIVQD